MKALISDKIHEDGIKILHKGGFEVEQKYSLSSEELQKEIANYDAIIVRSGTKLTAEILDKAEKLRAIGRAGVGLDNIDLKKAEELGIKVFNTPEAPSVSVAELTMGLILSLVRHIAKADKTMHCGEWLKSNYMGYVLKGKKIGIIGFGNIGSEIAKKASAFEMQIGIYDVDQNAKNEAKSLGYHIYNSVDELIQDVQIVSLHIPSTVHTENTIDERRLQLMSNDTILINTARGNLVDEGALIKALRNKKIGGAALDVYREEPLKNMDLCYCEENLILTPHIGSQTEETQIEASTGAARKIVDYFKSLK
ncbi:MAG: 3-phosphoglycerate dehydrogenase [Candidatus Lokiarchaeota archaeon]|nr:3-phosphoglycerate dehydrogenase [Candidatus Lokiarchaeota archaeon]